MTSLKKLRENKKNFLPTIILIIGLWILLTVMVFFVDPHTSGAVAVFLVILFLALLLTFSLLLANTRTGTVLTISITLYLALAAASQGNILNLLLIAGSALAFEIYFRTRT